MADGLNWYRYAGNNPIMYSDPTGQSSVIFDMLMEQEIEKIEQKMRENDPQKYEELMERRRQARSTARQALKDPFFWMKLTLGIIEVAGWIFAAVAIYTSGGAALPIIVAGGKALTKEVAKKALIEFGKSLTNFGVIVGSKWLQSKLDEIQADREKDGKNLDGMKTYELYEEIARRAQIERDTYKPGSDEWLDADRKRQEALKSAERERQKETENE